MTPCNSRWFNKSVAIERAVLSSSATPSAKAGSNSASAASSPTGKSSPPSPWNYALILDQSAPSQGIETLAAEEASALLNAPFTAHSTPIRLKVKTCKVSGWRAESEPPNPLPKSPVVAKKLAEPIETITLLPYAAAKLPITAPASKKRTTPTSRSAHLFRSLIKPCVHCGERRMKIRIVLLKTRHNPSPSPTFI